MPSPHPDHRPGERPTPKQLRYLRALALQRGQTFKTPATKKQASAEIRRLQNTPAQDWRDRAIEREQLATTPVPRDAARVRAGEITGYGANAHWTHTTAKEDRS